MTTLQSPVCTLSYPHLWKPTPKAEGSTELVFSAVGLLNKQQMKSPAQIEKTLKRMGRTQTQFLLNGLINKPTGKPSLVPAADPRPAMSILTAREAFRLSATDEEEV